MLTLISTPECDYIKDIPLEQSVDAVKFVSEIFKNLSDGFADKIVCAAIENFLIGNNFTVIEKDEYIPRNHICHEVADGKVLMVLSTNGNRAIPVDMFISNVGCFRLICFLANTENIFGEFNGIYNQ